MNVVLMVSAERGMRCVEKVCSLLLPCDSLTIFTFKETPWEPPYVDSLELLAKEYNIDLHITTTVHSDKYTSIFKSIKPDLLLLIGWRYLVPKKIYDMPTIGTFVFHDSMLPKYRGFSPTVWAMVNGEPTTGASLFKITDTMDEGDIFIQKPVNISQAANISEVTNQVTEVYLDMLEDAFFCIRNGEIILTPQDHNDATYTCKRIPEDNLIDWHDSAISIYNLIRATTKPYPGAHTSFRGEKMIIWSA